MNGDDNPPATAGSFFNPIEVPPISDDGPVPVPRDVIPGNADQRAILFQTETLAAAVHRFECFSSGFRFRVRVQRHGDGNGLRRFHFLFDYDDSWADHWTGEGHDRYDKPDDQFRLGLEFSDGTSWENFVDGRRAGPQVRTVGGSGSSNLAKQDFWVSSLPPPGDFRIYALWPNMGIEECCVTLSADAILAAARNETQLLPTL